MNLIENYQKFWGHFMAAMSRVLPSAKLVVDNDSLVIINTVGDTFLNRMVHGIANAIWSIFRRYRRVSATCENSIYIPFTSISSVGKKRCGKLKAALTGLAIPAAMALFGLELHLGLVIGILAVVAILATAFYVVIGNRYALTIEINSSFEYLLTTTDPNFVEGVYLAIKNIIEEQNHPTSEVIKGVTYDFRGVQIIDSIITAKELGT